MTRKTETFPLYSSSYAANIPSPGSSSPPTKIWFLFLPQAVLPRPSSRGGPHHRELRASNPWADASSGARSWDARRRPRIDARRHIDAKRHRRTSASRSRRPRRQGSSESANHRPHSLVVSSEGRCCFTIGKESALLPRRPPVRFGRFVGGRLARQAPYNPASLRARARQESSSA